MKTSSNMDLNIFFWAVKSCFSLFFLHSLSNYIKTMTEHTIGSNPAPWDRQLYKLREASGTFYSTIFLSIRWRRGNLFWGLLWELNEPIIIEVYWIVPTAYKFNIFGNIMVSLLKKNYKTPSFKSWLALSSPNLDEWKSHTIPQCIL